MGFRANSNFCSVGCKVAGTSNYAFNMSAGVMSSTEGTIFDFTSPAMTGFFSLNYSNISWTVLENKYNYIGLLDEDFSIYGKNGVEITGGLIISDSSVTGTRIRAISISGSTITFYTASNQYTVSATKTSRS